MTNNPYESTAAGIGHQKLPPEKFPLLVKIGLAILALVVLAFLFLPLSRGVGFREAVRRTECQNRLKQIALAMHAYESAHGTLPPAFTIDDDGQPLHSWRTLLLPYLEQQSAFDQIDFAKSWDDPANEAARKASIPVYSCPSQRRLADGHTTYLVVVGPDSCFPGSETRTFSDISDGSSNTLLVVEVCASQAVHWMKPVDATESMVFRAAASKTDRKVNEPPHSAEIFNVANADGSTRSMAVKSITDSTRRALISINGNDKVEFAY